MLREAKLDDIVGFENKSCLFSRVFGDLILSERLSFSNGAQFLTDGENLLLEIKNGSAVKIGEPSDSEELESILGFVAPQSVMSESDFGDIIVMKRKAHGQTKNIEINLDFKLKDFHRLFSDNGLESDKEGFMLGMSDAVKTGTGFLLGKYENEKLVGGLCVTGITDRTAILTAVAVDKSGRKEGLGSLLVDEACEMLSGRDVYIYREIGKNKAFYEGLGFVQVGSVKTETLR